MDYFNTKLYQIHKHKRKITKTFVSYSSVAVIEDHNQMRLWEESLFLFMFPERDHNGWGCYRSRDPEQKADRSHLQPQTPSGERKLDGVQCYELSSPTQWVLSPAAPQRAPPTRDQVFKYRSL